MKSYNHLPFDRAAAPTEQQQATDAIHTSSSKALPPWCSLKIRPLAKTIFVPLMIFLVFTNLVIPVAAMDNQISLATYPLQNTHDVFTANPPPRLPIRIPLTTIVTMAIFVVGYMMTMARQMLGPLMGVASIMSFILRNDAAVRPSISWAIFGIWSLATMMYLRHQTRQVKFDSLYILVTLMSAGICLCVVALVQKASIPGGLVTAIPPCISFAAYAVGFLFPDRGQPSQESPV